MADKLVIDSSSIISFFRYYCFDREDKKEIDDKLKEFLVAKIKKGEIIVIDKVYYRELHDDIDPEIKEFKKQIKGIVVDTIRLIGKIDDLIDAHLVEMNMPYFKDQNQIEEELERYKNRHADLYLVLYCKQLQSEGHKPVLITEETDRRDRKLLDKIPNICKKEKIECKTLPQALFGIYKDELKFKLDIKTSP
jgi:hypothetical protein